MAYSARQLEEALAKVEAERAARASIEEQYRAVLAEKNAAVPTS